MFRNDTCALFIGVNDYSAFDRSMGHKPRSSDLQGSENDVRMYWRMCRERGISPENMRALVSPLPGEHDWPAIPRSSLGEANEKGILDGLRWLAGKLAAPGGPSGLLVFSGHGAYLDGKGLLLCPSDTQGADVEHAIPFSVVADILRPAGENLTTILDCCHSGGGAWADPLRRTKSLTRGRLPAAVKDDTRGLPGRLLAACKVDEITEQARCALNWHGAFLFVLAFVMDQWRARRDGCGVRLDLSYGELIRHAKQVLATFSFDGTPALFGPAGVEDLAVFQRGEKALATCATPDGKRPGVQIIPIKEIYQATISDNPVALIKVPTEGTDGYNSAMEYWSTTSAFFASNPGDVLTLTVPSSEPSFPLSTSDAMPLVSMATAPNGFSGTGVSAPPAGWYTGLTSDSTYVGIVPSGVTLSSEEAPPRGTLTWWVATQVPLQGPPVDPEYAIYTPPYSFTYGDPPPLQVGTGPGEWQWWTNSVAIFAPTWSTTPGATSISCQGQPALTSFNAGACLLVVDTGGDLDCSLYSNQSWSPGRQNITSSSDNRFAGVTYLGEKLYCVYLTSEGCLRARNSSDGISWTGYSGVTNNVHLVSIGVASGEVNGANRVYVAYVTTNGNIHMRWSTDGSVWTNLVTPTGLTDSSTGAALAIMNGLLYLAYIDSNGDLQAAVSTSSGDQFSTIRVMAGSSGLQETNPCLFVHEELVWLVATVCQDGTCSYAYWVSADGKTWTRTQPYGGPPSGSTLDAPAATEITASTGTMLFLISNGGSSAPLTTYVGR